MLEFFLEKPTNGVANIYDSYITFNRVIANYLEDAYRVRVAIDRENKEIHFYKLNKDQALSKEYSEQSMLKVGITKTYARVCSKQLVDFISKAFDLTIKKKEYKQYKACYNDSKKEIIVSVKGGCL